MPASVSYNITYTKMIVTGSGSNTVITPTTTTIALGSSTTRVSIQSPYNSITIQLTSPSNESLIKFQARVTKLNESWDIDLGKQVLYDTNIASNTTKTYTLAVNTTNFSQGNGAYRVSLYTQSSSDNQWDVEHLFMVTEDGGNTWTQFNPTNGSSGMTVHRNSTVNEE